MVRNGTPTREDCETPPLTQAHWTGISQLSFRTTGQSPVTRRQTEKKERLLLVSRQAPESDKQTPSDSNTGPDNYVIGPHANMHEYRQADRHVWTDPKS